MVLLVLILQFCTQNSWAWHAHCCKLKEQSTEWLDNSVLLASILKDSVHRGVEQTTTPKVYRLLLCFFYQKKSIGGVTNNIYWPDSSDDHLDDPVHSHDGDKAAHSAGPNDKHTNHMEAAILFPAVAARGQHCAGVGNIWAVWVLHLSLRVLGNCVVASMQDMLLWQTSG